MNEPSKLKMEPRWAKVVHGPSSSPGACSAPGKSGGRARCNEWDFDDDDDDDDVEDSGDESEDDSGDDSGDESEDDDDDVTPPNHQVLVVAVVLAGRGVWSVPWMVLGNWSLARQSGVTRPLPPARRQGPSVPSPCPRLERTCGWPPCHSSVQ